MKKKNLMNLFQEELQEKVSFFGAENQYKSPDIRLRALRALLIREIQVRASSQLYQNILKQHHLESVLKVQAQTCFSKDKSQYDLQKL